MDVRILRNSEINQRDMSLPLYKTGVSSAIRGIGECRVPPFPFFCHFQSMIGDIGLALTQFSMDTSH